MKPSRKGWAASWGAETPVTGHSLPRPPGGFAARLLAWYRRHGRHDLPWQREPTPYRVWISEIMLQQTRVEAVVPFFERFMARFPDLGALAVAGEDEVLALWSGLGYYSRARNLLRAARQVMAEWGGELPADAERLMELPGIGRSTAGAIVALAHGRPAPILDGNVKRVLARHRGIQGWPGRPRVLRQLWMLAEALTPHEEVAAYTQAIMDLGATVCVRPRPACARCPVAADCVARRHGLETALPTPRPRRRLPERETYMLVVFRDDGAVLLERQAPSGVWGGLWACPQVASVSEAAGWWRERVGGRPVQGDRGPPIRHSFTHFRLTIHPIRYRLDNPPDAVAEAGRWIWYHPGTGRPAVGIPAPVATLIQGS